jgi:hypothetical protein
MKTIFYSLILCIACDNPSPQKEVCPPPPVCPVNTSLSGAYSLDLQQDTTSNYNDCRDMFSSTPCKPSLVSIYEGYAPRRLYLTDNGDHSVYIGLDDSCKGKIFDKHFIAYCLREGGAWTESTWYDFTIENNQVNGTMKFWLGPPKGSRGGDIFSRAYIVSGDKLK